MRSLGGRKRSWRPAHQSDNLPLHVHPGIIIVPQLRRRDPEADEDHRGGDARSLPGVVRQDNDLLVRLQLFLLAVPEQANGALAGHCLGMQQRHRLEVTAVGTRRLQPQRRELRRQVGRRQVVASRARSPPFQQVIGQEADVRPQGCRLNLAQGLFHRGIGKRLRTRCHLVNSRGQ